MLDTAKCLTLAGQNRTGWAAVFACFWVAVFA